MKEDLEESDRGDRKIEGTKRERGKREGQTEKST
jgi:hypothetical protein